MIESTVTVRCNEAGLTSLVIVDYNCIYQFYFILILYGQ